MLSDYTPYTEPANRVNIKSLCVKRVYFAFSTQWIVVRACIATINIIIIVVVVVHEVQQLTIANWRKKSSEQFVVIISWIESVFLCIWFECILLCISAIRCRSAVRCVSFAACVCVCTGWHFSHSNETMCHSMHNWIGSAYHHNDITRYIGTRIQNQ